MKKSYRMLSVAVAAGILLAGCGSSQETQHTVSTAESVKETEVETKAETKTETKAETESAPKEAREFEPITLRVAYMPNMGSASAIIAARDQGFFEEVGIQVELVQFQGGPAEIAAMSSGDIDIAQIGHGAHALCIEGQAEIFGLDLYGKSDAVMANKTKGIETIEDLKGKTVAVTAGTSSEIVFDLALQDAGMNRSDLELVEMDANGSVSAMISGKVDACATWSPGTNIILEQMGDNVITLADNADFFDRVAFPGSFIVTDKFAEENSEAVVRFYAAILKGMDYRKVNVEDVCRGLAKEIEADEASIIATKDNYEWLSSEDIQKSLEDGSLKQCYESQQQVFIDSGRISETVPVEDYVMFDAMKQALELYEEIK